MTRTQLLTFIEDIAEEEALYTGTPIQTQKVLSTFEKFETENDYLPEPVTAEEMASARKGICCASCNSFNIQINKFNVTCKKCKFVELREQAIVRTICEYGVLNFHSELRLKNLIEFFDGQLSTPLLLKILHKHFIVIKNGVHTYYINKKLPFFKIFNQFNFNKT